MFTDRFISIPIKHFNAEEANTCGKKDYECDQIALLKKILPMRVESYESSLIPGDEFCDQNMKCTNVCMQSGDSFLAFISVEEFEKLLNESV